MGVPGLWPLLAPSEVLPLAALPARFGAAPPGAPDDEQPDQAAPVRASSTSSTAAPRLLQRASSSDASSSTPPQPFILGIDVSAWLYHARASSGGANASLRLLLFRLLRLLSQPSLVPYFIFDGPARPRLKRGAKRRADEWPETRALQRMLDALGMRWKRAQGEAEAELAALNERGVVDGVMSDDVDALVFGAKVLVRNWSAQISTAPLEAAVPPSQRSSIPSSPRKQKSGGQATVAVFRAAPITISLPSQEVQLDRDGLILVALMSGGDYDVQGLVRCGVKIAIALAAAGFGARLVRAFKQHSSAPSRAAYAASSGLPLPRMEPGWGPFLASWLLDLRAELRSNTSGFLSARQAKLADSHAMREFLGSEHALAVLGSYVYPLVSAPDDAAEEEAERIEMRPVDLNALLSAVRTTLGWGADATLRRCRSLLWEGMVVRQLEQDASNPTTEAKGNREAETRPEALAKKQTRRKPLHDSPTATRISDFFAAASLSKSGSGSKAVAVAEQAHEQGQEQPTSPAPDEDLAQPRAALVELHSVRQGAGGPEVRAEWDVSSLVASARRAILDSEDAWRAALHARKAQEEAERFVDEDEEEDWPSESQQGPKRQPKAVDHDAPLRLWVSRDLLYAAPSTRALLRTWERRRAEKEAEKAEVERRRAGKEGGKEKGRQMTLEAFLRPQRAGDGAGTKAADARRPRTPPPLPRAGGSSAQGRAVKTGGSPAKAARPTSSSDDPREERESHSEDAESSDSLAAAWARSPSPTSQRLEDALLRRSGWPGTAAAEVAAPSASTSASTSAATASTSASGATPRASQRATASSTRTERQARRPSPPLASDSESDISFPSLGTLHAAGAARAVARESAAAVTTAASSAPAAQRSSPDDERSLPPPRKSPRKDAAQQSARAARADRVARQSPHRQSGPTRPSARAMAEPEEEETSGSSLELVAAPAPAKVTSGAAKGKRAKPMRARVSQAIVLSDSD